MTSIARQPLQTSATWLGPQLLKNDASGRRLTREQIADLENALICAEASGKSMRDLTRDDFPLPVLACEIAEWIQSLQSGRGFINVKGIPVDRYDAEDIGWIH